MKCHILFSEKNKKNISKCHLLKILPRVLSFKALQDKVVYPCFHGLSTDTLTLVMLNKLRCHSHF